ncbi:hypothetical protein K466DRAFT_578629 [Polyporus arcularius HHB13444]|uniref:Uncharacterized protein n=1 Tax=Polyporus arcularius HHB13444 TaxID=1314778 RepID=A0A5C3NVE3_9APHY|nr:hypothetical protein K466DRAFT_578629 [Polyporus arcularius HHB13444]
MMEVSIVAARANMFTVNWGARLVWSWVPEWICSCTLLESHCGDPMVQAAINSYLRSQKWSQDPEYTKVIVTEEMPQGLKHYIKTTILPCLNLMPSHDGKHWSWLLNGKSPIKKKGPRCGLHQSDFICFMLTEKFLPAFCKAHRPSYVAVILVNNSQGHSCYTEDALSACGAQACMHNGWYMKDGHKVTQVMRYPANHPHHLNKPKGMKAVLTEHRLWRDGLTMKCKGKYCDYTFQTLHQNMPKALQSVSVELIRKWEHQSWHFIDAYGRKKAKQLNSQLYLLHRCITEQLARAMDA